MKTTDGRCVSLLATKDFKKIKAINNADYYYLLQSIALSLNNNLGCDPKIVFEKKYINEQTMLDLKNKIIEALNLII